MRGEKAHFPLKGVPVFLGLRLRARHGQDDVAQQRGQLGRVEVEHRKRKHVGRAVDAAVLPVVAADGFVVAEQDVQLKSVRGIFRFYRGADGFFHFFQNRALKRDAGVVFGMNGDHREKSSLSFYLRLKVRAGVCARCF